MVIKVLPKFGRINNNSENFNKETKKYENNKQKSQSGRLQ